MSMIKFKAFHDYYHTKYNEKFGQNFQTQEYAAEQVEKFIKENHISDLKIKDIKFSVDSKGNEHILLIYIEENKEGV